MTTPAEKAAIAEMFNPLDIQIAGNHYKDMAIQPIEFITRNKIEFIPGCVIKRMCRYRAKNGKEDLLKARHEIDVLISLEYGGIQKQSTEIQRLQNETGAWSDSVFGSHRSATAPLHHLKQEVDEVIAAPADRTEYADCLILLLDAWRMAGGTADDLIHAAFDKLEVNKNREWGEPDLNGVVNHIRK